MNIAIDPELRAHLESIATSGWDDAQWAEREADDWFQSANYRGGYDADDGCFWFSYYAPDRQEYWFSFSLADVSDALSGRRSDFKGRPAGAG